MKEDLSVRDDLLIDEGSIEIPYALKKDFWNQLTGSVVVGKNSLLPMSVYKLCTRLASLHDLGLRTVEIDQIRGRVGLSQTFDKPLSRHGRTSIDLVKIENSYFVLDGHHWLSVATINNAEFIEAHVIEVEEAREF